MNNREAYKRAMAALDAANEDQGKAYEDFGDGWGSMSSCGIYDHIAAFLAHAFKQGPKPEPMSEETTDD